MNSQSDKACVIDAGFVVALLAAGLVVNMIFARMGFMPLDHSIVFDAGWRMLHGQVPWRDFVTPYAAVPGAMQALVFAIAGVNWFAYCLHSSIVNGLFAALVYVLLVTLRLPRPLAFFYGFCAAFFFYPPIGVPYAEQHSFFFTLAAITCAVAGNYAESRRAQMLLWASVPLLAVLAYFSKQVPSAYAAVSLPVVFLMPCASPLVSRFKWLAAGIAVTVTLFLLLALILGVHASDFVQSAVSRPYAFASTRGTTWAELSSKFVSRHVNLPEKMGLTFAQNAVHLYQAAVIGLPLTAALWLFARRRGMEGSGDLGRILCSLLLAPITYLSSMALGFVTNNQTQNSLAFYPVGAGLAHAAMCAELRYAASVAETSRASRLRDLLRRASLVAIVLISIVPVRNWTIDTINFATSVDVTRMVNDMTFDPALAARSASKLPRDMEFLRWTPSRQNYDLDGWSAVVSFLRNQSGRFLMIGDNLVTYGLARKPSIAPNLWFHPGLAMPDVSEPSFAAYEDDLIARAERNRVRYIVIEGEGPSLGPTLDQFSRVNAWLRAAWCQTRTFGTFRVYERCAPGRAGGD